MFGRCWQQVGSKCRQEWAGFGVERCQREQHWHYESTVSGQAQQISRRRDCEPFLNADAGHHDPLPLAGCRSVVLLGAEPCGASRIRGLRTRLALWRFCCWMAYGLTAP
jgi:hypothetical protein